MDLEKIRNDTPGVREYIHFNNAGASLMPRPVIEAVKKYFSDETIHGGYETAEMYASKLEKVYSDTARLINARPTEITFMENATQAWGSAFLSIPFSKGDVIITSMTEYASNFIAYLQVRKRYGVEIKVAPNDEYGQIDVYGLDEMIDERTRLISITHIPTNGGLVNPAEEIGKIAAENNVLYLLDACQSAGQYPLDVENIKCHFLSATGRKYLRAPRGTGFLYINENLLSDIEPIFLDLFGAEWTSPDDYSMREDARRFETWETNLAAKYGFGAAINYVLDIGIDHIWHRVQSLAKYLRAQLSEVAKVTVRDQGKLKCGIVTFSIENRDAAPLKKALHERKINVSVSVASSTLLDMEERSIPEMLRASVHYYNTEEEIDQFVETLDKLLAD